MSDIQVDYAGGDPLSPLSFQWRGLAVDADHRATAPVGVEGVPEEKSFLLLSGLEGSVLEHRIFEDEVGVVSLSTAKGLALARAQGIEIVEVTEANADAVLATLPFDLAVKEDIRQATARGLLVRVPTAPVCLLTWHGAAYLLFDEETGEAALSASGRPLRRRDRGRCHRLPGAVARRPGLAGRNAGAGDVGRGEGSRSSGPRISRRARSKSRSKAFKVLVTDVRRAPRAEGARHVHGDGGGGSCSIL